MGVFKNEVGRPSNEVKKKRLIIKIVLGVLLLGIVFILAYLVSNNLNKPEDNKFKDNVKEENKNNDETKEDNNEVLEDNTPITLNSIKNNSLSDFDLSFLQLENNGKNKVYSPISIKYALRMLEEGANGESKSQISNILGSYKTKKYLNSENMSFANAMFIKDTYKNSVKNNYVNTLKDKYNAEVIYDSFKAPNVLNSWVSDKTFNLINNLVDDIKQEDFLLVNALAIDMEWVKQIQSQYSVYNVSYAHRDYYKVIGGLSDFGYYGLDFKDNSKKAKSVEIGAVINKYDIVNTLGEENIRKTVGAEYKKWLEEGGPEECGSSVKNEPDVNTYLNKYIKEIDEGYKDISSSTDFDFYTDENVKVFAKDLKEYNGTTLQYIGIMPKNEELNSYIKNIKSSNINTLINNLKPIKLSSFKEGVITEIKGYIPMFKFDYELDFDRDLSKMGITNIFSEKADLSNLTNAKASINKAIHKSNIEFSNDGIKASAATMFGGLGDAFCGFDYKYEVPVEVIDLTFDKPYIFLIRDKKTGEVWFSGSVYEPIEYQEPSSENNYFY